MKRFLLLSALLLSVVGLAGFPVRIVSWQIRDDVKRLNDLHISVDYVNPEAQTIIADVVNEEAYQGLLSNGFPAERLPDPAERYNQSRLDGRDGERNYLSIAEYTTFMQNTAAQFPAICQLVQFGTSVQGRPLYFMKISDNVNVEEDEPEFRYFSSIHGNEVVGYDMCVRLITLLTSQYGINTRITNIVNGTEIWICPLLNPDGYVNQVRYNANGIDLNRNFPMVTGVQHPDGNNWAQETQAVMAQSVLHSYNLSANFHGGAAVVNYLWDYTYTLAPDDALLIQGALAYANSNPTLHNSTQFTNGITNGAAWYVITGSMQDWCYGFTDEIDYTIELGEDMWPPNSQLDSYWNNNQESMLSLMEFAQRGLNGTVTSASGAPLAATLQISGNAKLMHTDPDLGDYHRLLLPGTYTVTAFADGYSAQTNSVTIPTAGSATCNFVLSPAAQFNLAGTVVNPGGTAVANATVRLEYNAAVNETQTDAAGHFAFANLYEGNYTVNVSAAGFGTQAQTVALDTDNAYQIIELNPPVFSETFENGTAAWTLASPWAVYNMSGNNVLTDSPSGNYANNAAINATISQPVALQNLANPVLSFRIRYDLESGYDFLRVQASLTGTNWQNLAEFSGTQTTWQNVVIPLSVYAGQNLRLRFRLTSDNNVNGDGVYLDDIYVSGSNSQLIPYGDIDGNRFVNLPDAQAALDYCVGNDPLPAIDTLPWEANRIEAADVDNDNQVTPLDAYIIAGKCINYNGAFPAQGGTAYTYTNPNPTLQCLNGDIHVLFNNPENLCGFKLTFSSASGITLGEPQLGAASTLGKLAVSADNRTYAFAATGTGILPSEILSIPYGTADNQIHVVGMINNQPFDVYLDCTAASDPSDIPLVTGISSIYPNPVTDRAILSYVLARDTYKVRLQIFNAKGQLVRTLEQQDLPRGKHNLVLDATDSGGKTLPNGIYFCRLQTHSHIETRKLVILK